MIKVYPKNSLGSANYGWLKTKYHFSFAGYHNPLRMGMGNLLVINDDIIQPGKGFDFHPHHDMEIITYVRQGAITHQDSEGNQGRTEAGDIQIMSAGTGIRHAEHNEEEVETKLYQIWIKPDQLGLKPSWQTKKMPKTHSSELTLLVGRSPSAPLYIHQDASIQVAHLLAGTSVNHPLFKSAYLLVCEGCLEVDGLVVQAGDGAEIELQDNVMMRAKEDSQLLLIEA